MHTTGPWWTNFSSAKSRHANKLRAFFKLLVTFNKGNLEESAPFKISSLLLESTVTLPRKLCYISSALFWKFQVPQEYCEFAYNAQCSPAKLNRSHSNPKSGLWDLNFYARGIAGWRDQNRPYGYLLNKWFSLGCIYEEKFLDLWVYLNSKTSLFYKTTLY